MSSQLVTGYFSADHDRLDSLFGQYQALKYQAFEMAKPFFLAFRTGLNRHIVWEEDVLFPLFEAKTGMTGHGPTAVMREEHRRIRQVLEQMHDRIRREDSDTAAEESALLGVLGQHNQKEEQVLYPSVDRLISTSEAAQLFLDLDRIPEDRLTACGADAG